ncbi:MAG: caspase family protein [Rhizobiaceae bacterium]
MLRMTRRSLLLGASSLTAAGFLPLRSAMAQKPRTYHALLVAVTKYPHLPQKNWLIGPNHDSLLLYDYLTAKGGFKPENVTVLADYQDAGDATITGPTPPSAGSPTNAAIKEQFAALAKRIEDEAAAGGGDAFVYIHMSGHGANQPQRKAGDETDGLDEIFLPADTQMCSDIKDGLPNALVDDDIKSSLDAIRATGAFVWIVFDCCHSGSATRDVLPPGEEMDRKVEFLDVVDPSIQEEARAAMARAGSSEGTRGVGDDGERKPGLQVVAPTGAESILPGGLVAFYAAQTIETTPEMPLPKGDPDATRYGLFTYTIISKLTEAENRRITYRQLGHAVLQQYSADGRPRPTPLFEGVLDAPVFGTERIPQELQWPITVSGASATIPAGTLHRLTPGTKLAILPEPISEMSEAVGYVEVKSAKNLTANVYPVAFDDKPALKLADLPANAYARVAEFAVDYKLVVARPDKSEGLDAEVALANQVLDQLAADADAKFRIQLVEPGAEADLRFAVLKENAINNAAMDASDKPALWFLPASGQLAEGQRPPLVAIDVSNPEKLKKGVGDNLLTIYRATSLSRLAAASDYTPEQVTITFNIKRADTGAEEPLAEASVPFVKPGDQVHLSAKNLSSKLVDINVLYIGSDYSITHMGAQRLEKNSELNEGLLEITDTSFGMERMIAVLTEAPAQSEIEDLSFLQQGGVPPATRAIGGAAGFSDMLRDIGLAPATRAAMKLGDKGGNKGAVMIFPMETVPRG